MLFLFKTRFSLEMSLLFRLFFQVNAAQKWGYSPITSSDSSSTATSGASNEGGGGRSAGAGVPLFFAPRLAYQVIMHADVGIASSCDGLFLFMFFMHRRMNNSSLTDDSIVCSSCFPLFDGLKFQIQLGHGHGRRGSPKAFVFL